MQTRMQSPGYPPALLPFSLAPRQPRDLALHTVSRNAWQTVGQSIIVDVPPPAGAGPQAESMILIFNSLVQSGMKKTNSFRRSSEVLVVYFECAGTCVNYVANVRAMDHAIYACFGFSGVGRPPLSPREPLNVSQRLNCFSNPVISVLSHSHQGLIFDPRVRWSPPCHLHTTMLPSSFRP